MGLISAVIPKALLPIFTMHKMSLSVQPALKHLLVELFADQGIKEVCIVVSPNQVSTVKEFLVSIVDHISEDSDKVLSDAIKSGMVKFALQQEPLGLGDAILAAKEFIGDEPFMVALGDHVFTRGCVNQVRTAYVSLITSLSPEEAGSVAMTGTTPCRESEIKTTGLLQCDMLGSRNKVQSMDEKPKEDFDKYEIGKSGQPKQFLSQLGIDILPRELIGELERAKQLKLSSGGREEIGLRQIMKESLMNKGNLYCCSVNGHRFDIGTPDAYWNTLHAVLEASTESDLRPPQMNDHNYVKPDQLDFKKMLRHLGITLNKKNDNNYLSHVASAPGRIDLMGGFADYSGSRVLQHSTAKRCYVIATLTDEDHIDITSVQVPYLTDSVIFKPNEIKVNRESISSSIMFHDDKLISLSQLKAFIEGDGGRKWFQYIIGVVHVAIRQSIGVFGPSNCNLKVASGMQVTVISDIPWKTGMASSAAVEMSTFLAVGHALNLPSQSLGALNIALTCQKVENQIVGANCGLMDHLAIGFAPHEERNELLGFDCRLPISNTWTPDSYTLPRGMSIVAVDSGAVRSIADSPYNNVRVASLIGRNIINKIRKYPVQYLCEIPQSRFHAKYQRLLPEKINGSNLFGIDDIDLTSIVIDGNFEYLVRAATSHPIEEHARVLAFENSLNSLHEQLSPATRNINHELLGELMQESHMSYSNCGMGTSETDFLVSLLHNKSLSKSTRILGAKISGGGGGGALSLLLWSDKQPEESCKIEEIKFWESVRTRYFQETGRKCAVHRGTSGKLVYHGTFAS